MLLPSRRPTIAHFTHFLSQLKSTLPTHTAVGSLFTSWHWAPEGRRQAVEVQPVKAVEISAEAWDCKCTHSPLDCGFRGHRICTSCPGTGCHSSKNKRPEVCLS